jgi:hypothetical protein
MPWECPACHTPIRYQDYDRVLRGPAPYPCHICHLEMTRDLTSDSLVAVRPIEGAAPNPNTARAGRDAVLAMRDRTKPGVRSFGDQGNRGSRLTVRRDPEARPRLSQRG